jgi:glucose-6-phosphate isomerase
MTFKNLDTSNAFKQLQALPASDLKLVLSPDRIKACHAYAEEGLPTIMGPCP